MRRITVALMALMVTVAAVAPSADAGSVNLTTERIISSGLTGALVLTAPPEDPTRIFIGEQTTARIKIYDLDNGTLLGTPFLDIGSKAGSGSERGFLGLAFHPDYRNNGYFFVNYTNNSGTTVVERYTVSANPNIADASSAKTIIQIGQPFSNHNGGGLAFGPDGYLYVGMGDGGSGNDPQGNGQNINTLLGKMLRLDIDTVGAYQNPPDNPFVGVAGRDEIWSVGMRNPWRFSFDRATGDLYIGDVGQNAWEEITWESGASAGGENHGWRCMEATHCTGLSGCTCNAPVLTDPIHEYANAGSNCTVVGGYVMNSVVLPEDQGTYYFADYCSGNLWSFVWDGSTKSAFQSRNSDLDPSNLIGGGLRSFGEDFYGNVYIVEGGEVHKIIRQQGTVTLEFVLPTSHEVSAGQDLTYQISARNFSGLPQVVEGWIEALPELPFKSNPLVRKTKTIPGSATITKTLRVRVPAGADPGLYTLRMALGDYDAGTYTAVDALGFHIVP